jgi:hypothetical protein
MTVGLPGAGIGGLFYLAATLLLPIRSLLERRRNRAPAVSWRGQWHSVLIALGIMGGLWLTGWLLALVIPAATLAAGAGGHGSSIAARTVIPLATFGLGVGTLLAVLLAVEIAHRVQSPGRGSTSLRRLPRKGTSR